MSSWWLAAQSVSVSPLVYVCFTAAVLALLALDLGVFHRKAHAQSMRESLAWTAFWIALALAFGAAVYVLYEQQVMNLGLAVPVVGAPNETVELSGAEAFKLYVTAYVIEKSLSMDNVFVIAMIFASLSIPAALQHRVLFWGILGALVLRGVMITVGTVVIANFAWIVYVFGGILIISALRMALTRDEPKPVSENRLVRFFSRFLPISNKLEGQRLITRHGGRWHATPLFVALVIIESSDLIFAVDSIPAVFAITGDPFIVFTSNIMAVLGLRSLYFCLAAAVTRFRFLKLALVAVLLFVGIKLCLVHTPWKIPTEVALAVVLGLLISGITASLLAPGEPSERAEAAPTPEPGEARPAGLPGRWRWALVIWRTNRLLRRTVVLVVGSLFILAAIIVAPVPGPGFTILAPIGIAILASEFLWARRIAVQAIAQERGLRGVVDRLLVRFPRLLIVPIVGLFWLMAWLLSEHAKWPSWLLWSLAVPIATPMCYLLFRWWKVRAALRRQQRTLRGAPKRPIKDASYRPKSSGDEPIPGAQ